MNSLYTRLSVAFLFILLSLGTFILWDTLRSSQRYFLEFTQNLNSPIAMYMADNTQLIDARGFDTAVLHTLAGHVMMINPSAEMYLLDHEGKVAAHSLDESEVKRSYVSLAPIKEFLTENARYPLLGDNPKDITEQRIFSAHPLTYNNKLFGYIYVILAGDQHKNLLASITSSHTYKSMALTIAFAVLLAILTGFILFFKLTRRLQGLTNSVMHWQTELPKSDAAQLGYDHALNRATAERVALAGDEIDQLGKAYSEMAHQLMNQNQKLVRNDKQRRLFYANISHDLRTPLTTLQGYLETILLKQDNLTDEQLRRHLHTALKQSQRLQHLITQLFDLTRLSSDHYKLTLEEFSLLEISYDIMQDFAPLAEKEGVQLKVVEGPNSNNALAVLADIALIQRVFENLIDNALRYTPRNGVITIELRPIADDQVLIVVKDTGKGMSVKETGRILDRHYSSDANVALDEEHAGLGLAIVNHIVGLHGSKVDIKSVPGKGTEFSFYLPVARQHDKPQSSRSARAVAVA